MNRTWQLATAAVVGVLLIGLGAVWLGGSGGIGNQVRRHHRLPRRHRTRRPALSSREPTSCRCLATRRSR